jgi:glycosyltransferase involved in cell wall biosynthesis
VDDNVTGFLVQPKLPRQVEDKILYIMNHTEEARQMGLNGQQKVRDHFSISAMCSSFIRIYEKLIKKPVPGITPKQYAEAGKAAAGGLL